MSVVPSPDFVNRHAPLSKKNSTLIIVGVLAVHSMVAIGLYKLKIADVKPPKVTPPLDITFILPAPVDTVAPELKPKTTPKIHQKSQPIPAPTLDSIKPTHPTTVPKLKPGVSPITKSQTVAEKRQADKQPIKKPVEKQLQQPMPSNKEMLPKKIIPTPTNSEQIPKKSPAQNTIISQQTTQKAEPIQNQTKTNAQQQAEANNAYQQALAMTKAQAKQVADEKAKAKQAKQQQDKLDQDKKDKELADKKAAPVQNNTPVTFSEKQASWRNKPDFSCAMDEDDTRVLTASFRYNVDKQGNASVILTKSTGDTSVDKQLTKQAKSAKFHPFIKNGAPVVGILNLSFRCQ